MSPTSTASSSSSAMTCSLPCTTRRVLVWPLPRSACKSASSSTTSMTIPVCSSTQRSPNPTVNGCSKKAVCRCRACRSKSCARSRSWCRASTSTATRSHSKPTNCSHD
ncbi:UNVERIFIED_CONTAM: hypothetical protein GTU68_046287 [Idotea baltica]|nr:hypothetical protein [Idotea baltica]